MRWKNAHLLLRITVAGMLLAHSIPGLFHGHMHAFGEHPKAAEANSLINTLHVPILDLISRHTGQVTKQNTNTLLA